MNRCSWRFGFLPLADVCSRRETGWRLSESARKQTDCAGFDCVVAQGVRVGCEPLWRLMPRVAKLPLLPTGVPAEAAFKP